MNKSAKEIAARIGGDGEIDPSTSGGKSCKDDSFRQMGQPTEQPVGGPVDRKPVASPSPERLSGETVVLRPIDPSADAEALFASSHGDPDTESLWTYMGYGPFESSRAMSAWLEDCASSSDPRFLAVTVDDKPVGMVSFLNIVPDAFRLEVGHIWYAPAAQRTRVNTEAIYLMLSESFDRLRYRRVEWKCDALNARSSAAALRLGFTYEGLFRQHLVYKGRNRDTAWYAMLDSEWPAVKANLERWLYDNPDGTFSLTALSDALGRNPRASRDAGGG